MASRSIKNFKKDFNDLDLPLHGVRLPTYEVDKDFKRKIGISEDADNKLFLKKLCEKNLKEKKSTDPKRFSNKEYKKRLDYELKTLEELGFIDYVLLVWDVINFCKQSDIPTGLGRGSAAGSLVLYLIGVTKIDPVKWELYFERFVSKTRAKKKVVDGVTYLDGSLMCDVDLDICYYNRQKVLQYLEKKFKGKTSKILTLNTLSTKLLMKECGKIVGGKDETEMNKVSHLIPKVFGIVRDLESSYEEVEELREWCDLNRDCYDIALKLRSLIKNKGVHPSAISISYEPMMDSCPLELTSDKENLVSSYDMNWVSLFNVKLDILGLRAVSVVDDVCKNINVDMNQINLSEPIIYENLRNLKTPHGLFQIEAETNFKVCKKVAPRDLSQLSAVLALGRPGALAFVDKYADRGESESIHPFFDEILSSTSGVALYQEQLMKMAHKVGFTLDEAEILRRIVGKKKVSEVRKWKKKIKDKVEKNNLDPEVSDILWKVLQDSANYSFNKSHSISYAALSAITIYLKFKYPQQFFLSLLKMTRHEPDPISEISKIHKEMDFFGLKLKPPHLIESQMDFSIDGKDIRFGLLSIKGIKDKSYEKINNFRDEYSSKFQIFEAASSVGIPIGVLCALIQAGALEGFKQSRTKVVYEAQLWNILTKREKKLALEKAEEEEHDLVSIVKKLTTSVDENGKPFIKESRFATIKKKLEPYKRIYEKNKSSSKFANWYYEKHLLGYTYGIKLKDIFGGKFTSITDVNERPERTQVKFIGNIEDKPYSGTSRAKKNPYVRMLVGDENNSVKVMIFNEKIDRCKQINEGSLPEQKEIVVVRGTKMDEGVFADEIVVQDYKIYTKLSELKTQEKEKEIV